MTYENMTDREIDALVAEKVFQKRYWLERRGREGNHYELAVGMRADGREPWYGSRDWKSQVSRYREVSAQEAQRIGFHGVGIAEYSRDISAAFEVVEAMRERTVPQIRGEGDHWVAEFCIRVESGGGFKLVAKSSAMDESLPRAICIAALRALDA